MSDPYLLPREYPRQIVDQTLQFGKRADVLALAEDLSNRPVETRQQLEHWLRERQEFYDGFDEAFNLAQIDYFLNLQDMGRREWLSHFTQDLLPNLRSIRHEWNCKYLSSPARAELDMDVWGEIDYLIETQFRLYRETNLALQQRVDDLEAEYQMRLGCMSVSVGDREVGVADVMRLLQDPDRKVREAAWTGMAQRLVEEADVMEDMFDEMLALREQIARNADYSNYQVYKFRRLMRRDYRTSDCELLHTTVKQEVLPLQQELLQARRQKLGLDELRPWDLHVCALGGERTRVEQTPKEIVDQLRAILQRIDPRLGHRLHALQEMGVLDLEPRPGKYYGSLNRQLRERRLPYVLMNLHGGVDDLLSLVYQVSQANLTMMTRDMDNRDLATPRREFALLSARLLELLVADHLRDQNEAGVCLWHSQVHRVVHRLCQTVRINEYEFWLYRKGGVPREERHRYWQRSYDTFWQGEVNTSGLEDYLRYEWHLINTMFIHPLTSIEQTVAQLGALEIWQRYKQEPKATIRNYEAAAAAGQRMSLRHAFIRAGTRIEFMPDHVKPLMEGLRESLHPSS